MLVSISGSIDSSFVCELEDYFHLIVLLFNYDVMTYEENENNTRSY